MNQGIADELMGFERGVTVAGGLTAIITTPAHGTAFDIAGKSVADPARCARPSVSPAKSAMSR